MHILMISNSRTDDTSACADTLNAAFGGRVEWLPDERRFIDGALTRSAADPDCRTILLCGGDALGPSPHLQAAVSDALQSRLPGFGEALRRRLEVSLEARAILVSAPAGSIGNTAVFTIPLSETTVAAAIQLLQPILDIYHRHLRGEVLPEIPAAPETPPPTASSPEAPTSSTDEAPSGSPPTLEAEFEDIPEEISITAMPDASAPPEQESLATGWRAGLQAIGGRLDSEIWAEIPRELAHIAPAREILEGAGQRAAVFLPDGRMMAIFGYPDLQRNHSKVLLVGDGAPIAEVVALHRHPHLAGLTIWGTRGLLPSADTDAMELARQRLGCTPPSEGELFAIDHDAIYLQQSGAIYRWDGRNLEQEGTENQVLASLMLRWSQR